MEDKLKGLQPENLTVTTFRAEGMPIDRPSSGMRITDNVLKIQVTSTYYDNLGFNKEVCLAGLKAATKRLKRMSNF